jgi:hypothetical protein
MPKKTRPLERSRGVDRDASLVIIASEDQYAVKQYFELFHSTKIQFQVLPTQDGRSSPQHVVDRLKGYMEEHQFGEGDRFWYVTDVDHWSQPAHIKKLVDVLRLCRQAKIDVALSRPCFELWLLLHFSDFPTADLATCKPVIKLLREVIGGYNKARVFDLQFDDDKVRQAITRSRAKFNPKKVIPDNPQTALHLIIEDLMARRIIHVPDN